MVSLSSQIASELRLQAVSLGRGGKGRVKAWGCLQDFRDY